MKTQFIYLIVIFLPFFSPFNTFGQIVFPNPAFEDDSNCDPEDCEETHMDCITDWWNFDATSVADSFAWIFYNDYFDCTVEDLELESCGGKRGIRISTGTGGSVVFPTTHNPFYKLDPHDAYAINFHINIFDSANDRAGMVELFVSDDSTGTGGT